MIEIKLTPDGGIPAREGLLLGESSGMFNAFSEPIAGGLCCVVLNSVVIVVECDRG